MQQNLSKQNYKTDCSDSESDEPLEAVAAHISNCSSAELF